MVPAHFSNEYTSTSEYWHHVPLVSMRSPNRCGFGVRFTVSLSSANPDDGTQISLSIILTVSHHNDNRWMVQKTRALDRLNRDCHWTPAIRSFLRSAHSITSDSEAESDLYSWTFCKEEGYRWWRVATSAIHGVFGSERSSLYGGLFHFTP